MVLDSMQVRNFNFPGSNWDKNVIIFEVDNSSSVYVAKKRSSW